jgi:hypothetical protein
MVPLVHRYKVKFPLMALCSLWSPYREDGGSRSIRNVDMSLIIWRHVPEQSNLNFLLMSVSVLGHLLISFLFSSLHFLAADSEVPSSIPGATKFSEYQWVWNGVHSALVRINEELLERKSSGSGLEKSD